MQGTAAAVLTKVAIQRAGARAALGRRGGGVLDRALAAPALDAHLNAGKRRAEARAGEQTVGRIARDERAELGQQPLVARVDKAAEVLERQLKGERVVDLARVVLRLVELAAHPARAGKVQQLDRRAAARRRRRVVGVGARHNARRQLLAGQRLTPRAEHLLRLVAHDGVRLAERVSVKIHLRQSCLRMPPTTTTDARV